MRALWELATIKQTRPYFPVSERLGELCFLLQAEHPNACAMSLNDYILVIADHDPNAFVFYAEMLEPKDYTVHVCGNGEEALRLFRIFRPAAVVLDLDLPVLDGCATAERLQSDPDLAGIRQIAITVFSDERSSARAWTAGFHEFLPKPVPRSMLLAIVRPTREMQGIIDGD
jgi:CheY-like chemotaxis protein